MPEASIKVVEPEASHEIAGHVKWFDATRGFGFLTSSDVDGDILLHINVLRNFGQSSIAEGSAIRALIQRTKRGQQAVELLEISPPSVQEDSEDAPEFMQPIPEGTPYVAARVKWYDRGKGFGFANVFGDPEDIFVPVSYTHLRSPRDA